MVSSQPSYILPHDNPNNDPRTIQQIRTQDNYLSSVVIEKQTPEKKRNRTSKSIRNVTNFLHKSVNVPTEPGGRSRRKKLTYLTSRNQNQDITTNAQQYSYQPQSTNENIDEIIVRNTVSHTTLVPRSEEGQQIQQNQKESFMSIHQHSEASDQNGAYSIDNAQVASKSQGTFKQPGEDEVNLKSHTAPDSTAVLTPSSYLEDNEIENIQLPECFQQVYNYSHFFYL